MKNLCLFIAICLMLSVVCGCSNSAVANGTEVDNTTYESNQTELENTSENSSSLNQSNTQSENTSSDANSSQNSSSKDTSSNKETSSQITISAPEKDPGKAEWEQWYLKLVNPDNSVSKEFIDNVNKKAITTSYTNKSSSSKYLDERVVASFEAMCKAAKKDGITLYTISSYRSYSYQENLFKKRIQRVINEEGLSEEKATEKAATIVARPGTSEHHLGLAVDIISVETNFEKTKEFKWLQEHAEEYGFIMRYPKDKKSITKIIYEPWHYRYVGVEHAKEMNNLGLCLEEYIELLKEMDQ